MKKLKKEYITPTIDVVNVEDIITTSAFNDINSNPSDLIIDHFWD